MSIYMIDLLFNSYLKIELCLPDLIFRLIYFEFQATEIQS